MNDDLFRYKIRFLTGALLLAYVYLHVTLTGSFVDATLLKDFEFTSRLPFGQRLLVPVLVRCIVSVVPISMEYVFFLFECAFVALFYWALVKLLEFEFKPKQAQLLAWLFILLLPLMTVVNYRFTKGGLATFYYPYDSAALFFLTLGFLFCLRKQWSYLLPLIFVATFNRESSILLVLLIPALHWKTARPITKPFFLACIAYVLARAIVLYALKDVPGDWLEWYYNKTLHTYFEINLYWLFNQQHILFFLFCLAGLPFFWFTFYDYIPLRYRPLRFVALFYFLGLLLVGNFREARLFCEIAVLLYLPVCLAITHWMMDQEPYASSRTGILRLVDRYGVLGILVFIIVFHSLLNEWLLWFLQ